MTSSVGEAESAWAVWALGCPAVKFVVEGVALPVLLEASSPAQYWTPGVRPVAGAETGPSDWAAWAAGLVHQSEVAGAYPNCQVVANPPVTSDPFSVAVVAVLTCVAELDVTGA